MNELCIRCELVPAEDPYWPECEACWQLTCDEVHEAWAADPIHQRMEREGIDFVTAVQREARSRGLR